MEKAAAVKGNDAGASSFRRTLPLAAVKEQPPDFDDGPDPSFPPEGGQAAAAATAAAVAAPPATAEDEDEDEDEDEESASDEPAPWIATPHRSPTEMRSKSPDQGARTAAAVAAGHYAVMIARGRGPRLTPTSAPSTGAAGDAECRDRWENAVLR